MERFYFESDIGKISYLRRKGKKHVLFIHGFTASAYIWRSLPKYFNKSYDLIFVDLPGHGKSDFPSLDLENMTPRSLVRSFASAINDLIDDLSIISYPVVGSSMGGWIALELATQFNNRNSVVLIDSAGIMGVDDSKFTTGFFELLQDYMKRKRKAGKMLLSMVLKSDPSQLMMDPALLDQIDFRTCILWGSEDHILDPEYGRKLNKKIKNSELHIIEGADHVPFRTHPEEVAGIIKKFLKDEK